MKRGKYVYCICYLDNKYYININRDLVKHKYLDLKAIVPEISLVKRFTCRGKPFLKKIPLLFNYGFIRMPLTKAMSRTFLNEVKSRIPGIRGWLKDTSTLHPRKKKIRVDNADIFDDFSIVATCPRKTVKYFVKLSKKNQKTSYETRKNVKVGDLVTLKGYPFHGSEAVISKVDLKSDKVKVILYPNNCKLEIELPLDNVIYSVYDRYDPDMIYTNDLVVKLEDMTTEKLERCYSLKN